MVALPRGRCDHCQQGVDCATVEQTPIALPRRLRETLDHAPRAEGLASLSHGTGPHTEASPRSKYRSRSNWGTASPPPHTSSPSRCTWRCTWMTPAGEYRPLVGSGKLSRRLRPPDHANQEPLEEEVQLHIHQPSSNSPCRAAPDCAFPGSFAHPQDISLPVPVSRSL